MAVITGSSPLDIFLTRATGHEIGTEPCPFGSRFPVEFKVWFSDWSKFCDGDRSKPVNALRSLADGLKALHSKTPFKLGKNKESKASANKRNQKVNANLLELLDGIKPLVNQFFKNEYF